MINLVFSALAVVHLTYLGSVFTSSVDYMEEDEVSGAGTCTSPQSGAEPGADLLSSVGRSNPPHHSEVVRAELDEPLGHVWLLGALPAPSLISRHRCLKKEGKGSNNVRFSTPAL